MNLLLSSNSEIIKEGIIASLQEWNDEKPHFINSNLIKNNMLNNFVKYLVHSVVGVAILGGLSLIINLHPAWFGITIGSLVVNLYNYLIATQSVSTRYTPSV